MPGNKYMPLCLAMVDAADAVFLLEGWRESPEQGSSGIMPSIRERRYYTKGKKRWTLI
jgi:hypothetical protein